MILQPKRIINQLYLIMADLTKKSDAELIEIVESTESKYSAEMKASAEQILEKRGYELLDEDQVQKVQVEEPEKKPMSLTRTLILLGVFVLILGGRIATSNGGSWSMIGIILPVAIIGLLLMQLATRKK